MVAIETPHDSFRRVFTHPLLQGCVLVALAVVIALLIEVPGRFPDPDSLYHAGMAELALSGTFPQQFPWLTMTAFPERFADLHLVYHLLLVPFVKFLGTVSGIRIATVVSIGLLTAAWYGLLRALRVRGAFVFSLLLLGSAAFMFRLNLAKAQGFAFTVLFLGLAAAARRSAMGVFVAAAFAAWISSHWPVLTAGVGAIALCQFVVALVDGSAPRLRFWRPFGRAVGLVCAALAGNAAALVINPYFPENLAVAYDQIVRIALIGGVGSAIPGGEWQAMPLADLLTAVGYLLPLVILAALGISMLIVRTVHGTDDEDRATAAHAGAFALLTVLFGAMTLAAKRHVEFLIPFATLAVATGMQPIVDWFWPPRVQIAWRIPGEIRRRIATIALCVSILAFGFGAWRGHAYARERFAAAPRADQYRPAAEWIAENTPQNAIIFHADWDDFPALFLWNRTNRYLVGLDPRFAHFRDAERYAALLAIRADGLAREDHNDDGKPDGDPVPPLDGSARIAERIVRVTGASYAMVTTDQTGLRELLDADRGARRVYEDDEAMVYRIDGQ